ncbi:MAG: hypothetical protein AB8B72_01170 [Crocinitomicaceae bacterium]
MMMKHMFKGVVGLLLGFALVACGDGSAPVEDIDVEAVDSTALQSELDAFESPEVDYHLPSALQVASIFKKAGMTYNSSATNGTDKTAQYTSEAEAKLNFGVYSADLAYCITNNQSNDARKFISAIQTLAGLQGMESVFENKDLMTRFDNNLENKDSIQTIIVEIHERSQEYMEENQMEHVAAVHYAGAWVEGMHLGYTDFKANPSNENAGFMLAEQMEILDNIIKGLKDPRNSEVGIEFVTTALESIRTNFENFDSVKAYRVSDQSADLTLSNEEITNLGEMVSELRVNIVK